MQDNLQRILPVSSTRILPMKIGPLKRWSFPVSISELASPSTASPLGLEEDVAKMTEEDIEAGANVGGKITLSEVDRMTSHPIDSMGDEV